MKRAIVILYSGVEEPSQYILETLSSNLVTSGAATSNKITVIPMSETQMAKALVSSELLKTKNENEDVLFVDALTLLSTFTGDKQTSTCINLTKALSRAISTSHPNEEERALVNACKLVTERNLTVADVLVAKKYGYSQNTLDLVRQIYKSLA